MYSNNILNFQESTTILNACTKKIWKPIEYTKYILTFKPNIFSVQVTAKNGAHISFKHDYGQLIFTNGAVLNITQSLYYLKNIISARNATYHLHGVKS